ncbi:hypothetical protein BDY21DRAFT_360294 [Lineolata rhizophorae]|uniref:Uncharacterized protein n=1 Tax=Lineolata rhizophorae TaxID=578093 RepID=A0A6A6PF25_9PEZI|nr:hypothetical protein BDY21DRAFT_360294 [Lineolata rhizophorae]
MNVAGGVIYTKDAATLVVPVAMDKWKFLDPKADHHPQAKLHFYVFDRLPPPNAFITSGDGKESSQSSTKQILSALYGIQGDSLFEHSPTANRDKNVFLLFHPRHSEEIELATKYFHSLEATMQFHSEFYDFGSLPGLLSMINGNFNFFKLGSDDPLGSWNDMERYTFSWLLPAGEATLITDDVIVHRPAEALKVFTKLDSDFTKKKSSERKVVGRPGFMHFVQQLMMQEAAVMPNGQDNPRMRLASQVFDLVPPHLLDPYHPLHPSEDSHLLSVHPDTMPEYPSLWDRNEEAATEKLAEWFAGWAVVNLNKFRRVKHG